MSMTEKMQLLYAVIAAGVAMSFLLLWTWEKRKLRKERIASRNRADGMLAAYALRSDQAKYAFLGRDAFVIFRKEEFLPKGGHLATTFIYLCRNAFDEYFFCVIDVGLSAIHIPKERALLFLKDFPKEYAAEIDYLASH